MSRFETQFATLNAKNEGAFVPFVTLCDPTFDRSFEIICTLVDNGADALELGFPFPIRYSMAQLFKPRIIVL